MIVLVATMAWLTWWQASRALSGNTLSYVYAFEWPLLAGVVVYMWWDLLHERPDHGGRRRPERAGAERTNGLPRTNGAVAGTNGDVTGTNGDVAPEVGPVAARYRDDEDEELAAYNRYLAELNASGRRKTWRHPT
jgi:hypothetical protein